MFGNEQGRGVYNREFSYLGGGAARAACHRRVGYESSANSFNGVKITCTIAGRDPTLPYGVRNLFYIHRGQSADVKYI